MLKKYRKLLFIKKSIILQLVNSIFAKHVIKKDTTCVKTNNYKHQNDLSFANETEVVSILVGIITMLYV
jgi:hypothetical protein